MSCSFTKYGFTCLLMLVVLKAQSQRYQPGDEKKIQQQRKEQKAAIRKWDKAKLFTIGSFFEKIYDKYRDSSMNAAIRCYTLAASSESEYGDGWDSYAAASKLAGIYETGKGIPKNLHRSLIYYYLADTSQPVSSYSQLSTPQNNKAFERVKEAYCATTGVTTNTLHKYGLTDSIVLRLSPFCSMKSQFPDSLLQQAGQYLQERPDVRVESFLRGHINVPAAQYTLKAENFVLPSMAERFITSLVEKMGISPERFSPLQKDFYAGGEEYILSIRFIAPANH